MMLILSLALWGASIVFKVGDGQQVVVPLVNRPLPRVCLFARTTGIDCPGCGLSRSFISLAHGDLAAAWHFNPAGLLLFSLLVLQVPYRSVQLWQLSRGRQELNIRGLNCVCWALGVTLLGQWLIRLLW